MSRRESRPRITHAQFLVLYVVRQNGIVHHGPNKIESQTFDVDGNDCDALVAKGWLAPWSSGWISAVDPHVLSSYVERRSTRHWAGKKAAVSRKLNPEQLWARLARLRARNKW